MPEMRKAIQVLKTLVDYTPYTNMEPEYTPEKGETSKNQQVWGSMLVAGV